MIFEVKDFPWTTGQQPADELLMRKVENILHDRGISQNTRKLREGWRWDRLQAPRFQIRCSWGWMGYPHSLNQTPAGHDASCPLGPHKAGAENAWKCMKNGSQLAETVSIHHSHGDRGRQVIHSIIIQWGRERERQINRVPAWVRESEGAWGGVKKREREEKACERETDREKMKMVRDRLRSPSQASSFGPNNINQEHGNWLARHPSHPKYSLTACQADLQDDMSPAPIFSQNKHTPKNPAEALIMRRIGHLSRCRNKGKTLVAGEQVKHSLLLSLPICSD